jgi:hypothetical protein
MPVGKMKSTLVIDGRAPVRVLKEELCEGEGEALLALRGGLVPVSGMIGDTLSCAVHSEVA